MLLLKGNDNVAMPRIRTGGGMTRDTIWTEIHSELTRVYADLRLNSHNGESLHAFESTLRLQAAAGAALGLDAMAIKALTAAVAAGSRKQIIDEALRRCQRHRFDSVWRAVVARSLDKVLDAGYTPPLLGAANLIWKLAQCDSAVDHESIHCLRTNRDRESIRRTVDSLTAITFILQRVAIGEPPLMPACAALALTVGIMEVAGFHPFS